jgi:hypothetical protein
VKVTKKWFTDGTGRGMIVDESDSTVPPDVCYFTSDTSTCVELYLAKEVRIYSTDPRPTPSTIGWRYETATEGAAWNDWVYWAGSWWWI